MTTLKGIFPNPKPTRRKNFILENVKNLRLTEKFFHTKEVEEFRKLRPRKKSLDKYRNVASGINSTLRGGEKKEDSLEKESIRRSDKKLSTVRIAAAAAGGCSECKVSAPIRSKNPEANARIGQGSTKQNSQVTSIDISMRRRNNRNKSGELPNFDANIFGESRANCKTGKKYYVVYKNQEIQTLDTEDLDSLYKEGVIRYPSGRIICKKNTAVASSDRINDNNSGNDNDLDINDDDAKGESSYRKCASSPSDRGDGFVPRGSRRGSFDRADSPSQPMTTQDQIDRVKLNKQRNGAITVAEKLVTRINNGVPSANHRKGVVPKYIRDRKEAQRQQQQRTDAKMKEAASHPDCPEGHVPLPNDERKETLRMLKKHHQEYVNELNMMPIKTDTLRSHRRKMEIERQLNKLEEGIKVFSRPKVYVEVNS